LLEKFNIIKKKICIFTISDKIDFMRDIIALIVVVGTVIGVAFDGKVSYMWLIAVSESALALSI